ncbi:MAG: hypothetical protein ACOYUB_02185 [Patescibacteria group bacterium]
MENLYENRDIVRRDIEQVYQGLFLDCVTSFERVIEIVFFGLLMGKTLVQNCNNLQKVVIKSYLVAKELLYENKKYTDWLPYNNLEAKSKRFFHQGQPFTILDEDDKRTIFEIVVIRNTIAHKSKFAIEKFKKTVIESLILSPREKTPAGFLRSIYRTNPDQTRYELYSIELVNIIKKILSFH